ncbi:peptidoglycan-binding domain-containing protein [Ahrensia marina]|uniref:peptidoglycan-binding domain-containing protein n=1 Tax=Ahrensia marina TaxID=1514904 RepID=UPI00316AD1DD
MEAVRSLQQMLTAAGYAVQSDGIFGVETDRALRQFQVQEKLVVDGIFGPESRARLKQVLPRLGRFLSILAIIMRIMRLMR